MTTWAHNETLIQPGHTFVDVTQSINGAITVSTNSDGSGTISGTVNGTPFTATFASNSSNSIALANLYNSSGQLIGQEAAWFGGSKIDDLSFSNYGDWIAKDTAGNVYLGAVGGGQQTPIGSMPVVGSATYNGHFAGFAAQGSPTAFTPWAIAGSAAITANFSNQSVTESFGNFNVVNLLNDANGSIPGSITGTSNISGNTYAGSASGTLNGSAISGSLHGVFTGQSAEETAGTMQLGGQTGYLQASYGAKR